MIPGSYYGYATQRESSGNPRAKNPRSTATGLHQFLEGTWADLSRRRPDLGLTPDGRTDPEQSTRAMKAFTEENAATLKNKGHEPTQANLYLAHRFGPGGALKALSANPDTPVSDVFPEVMSANPDLRGKRIGDITGMFGNTDYSGQRRVFPAARGGLPAVPAEIDPADGGALGDKFLSGGIGALFGAPNGVFKNADGSDGYDLGTAMQQAAIYAMAGDNPSVMSALPHIGKKKDTESPFSIVQGKNGRLYRFNKKTGLLEAGEDAGKPEPTEYEKAYDREAAQSDMKANDALRTGASAAKGKLATLNELDSLLKDPNVIQGWGGEKYSGVKKFVKSVLGIDVSGVAAEDAIKAISNKFALEMRNTADGNGMPGAMSDKDREFLKQMVPGLENTPGGNQLIMGYMRKVAERQVEAETLRQKFIAESGGRFNNDKFTAYAENYFKDKPLFAGAPPTAAAPQSSALPKGVTSIRIKQ